MLTWPAASAWRPRITRSSVVFPAPFEPIKPTNWPEPRLNLMSCNTSRPPSRTHAPSTTSTSVVDPLSVAGELADDAAARARGLIICSSQSFSGLLAGDRAAQGMNLGQHPGLVGKARRLRLVNPDDRDTGLSGLGEERRGHLVDHLLVVDQHLDLVFGKQVLLQRHVLRRQIYTVHDSGLQPERSHVAHAKHLQEIVANRLSCGNRSATVSRLECRDRRKPRLQRGVEGSQPRFEVRGVRRPQLA